jgi:hypothetical protein
MSHNGFLPSRGTRFQAWQERAGLYMMSSCFEKFSDTLAEAMTHGLLAARFDCDTDPRGVILVALGRRFRWRMRLA